MASSCGVDFTKILVSYKELGEKKLIKKSLKDLDINKKVYLHYSTKKQIPICALPRLRLILTSKYGFVSFCYNFYCFLESFDENISICPSNIKCIAKYVISHEVGHILDPDIYSIKNEYGEILSSIIDKLLEYDVDINDINLHKANLPSDLEESVLALKRNLIIRESTAWDIAKSNLTFNNSKEEFIFNKIREYALATYNFGNLKNVIKEHNIDMYFKYKKYFS